MSEASETSSAGDNAAWGRPPSETITAKAFTGVAPITPDEMIRMRNALQRCIASGIKVVEYDGRKVEYQSIADMRRALADLERKINIASG